MKFGVRGRLIFEGLEGGYETPYLIMGVWVGGEFKVFWNVFEVCFVTYLRCF